MSLRSQDTTFSRHRAPIKKVSVWVSVFHLLTRFYLSDFQLLGMITLSRHVCSSASSPACRHWILQSHYLFKRHGRGKYAKTEERSTPGKIKSNLNVMVFNIYWKMYRKCKAVLFEAGGIYINCSLNVFVPYHTWSSTVSSQSCRCIFKRGFGAGERPSEYLQPFQSVALSSLGESICSGGFIKQVS